MDVTIKEGKYIYCIIALKEARSFGPLGIGDRSDELHTIFFDDIAAVVSNSPIIKYPVSRQNLLSHEKAIELVMKEYVVLPVRFGTIAEGENKIKKILEKECDNFKDLLDKLEGKKELGLKAVFKENIYKDILKKYQDIKAVKEKISKLPPEKTHLQRMEIGRMVEAALQKEKEAYKDNILNVLLPLAEDSKVNNNYGELMIVNAAFLIKITKESEFDKKVQEFDTRYADLIKFKYIGIVPPFNFVNLTIETGRY